MEEFKEVFLQSRIQATDERIGSGRFFSPTKTARLEIENEMRGYLILWFGRSGIHTAVPDGQTVNVDWHVEVLKGLIMVHIPCKRPYYCNGQWKLDHDNVRPHVAQRVRDFLTLSRIRTYVNYQRIAENKQILNIRLYSGAFSHKLTSNCENWFSHTVFANVRWFGKFGSAENVFGT